MVGPRGGGEQKRLYVYIYTYIGSPIRLCKCNSLRFWSRIFSIANARTYTHRRLIIYIYTLIVVVGVVDCKCVWKEEKKYRHEKLAPLNVFGGSGEEGPSATSPPSSSGNKIVCMFFVLNVLLL